MYLDETLTHAALVDGPFAGSGRFANDLVFSAAAAAAAASASAMADLRVGKLFALVIVGRVGCGFNKWKRIARLALLPGAPMSLFFFRYYRERF